MKRLEGKQPGSAARLRASGEAVARLFAAEGARVAVVGRRHQLALKIVDEIGKGGGKRSA